MKYGQVGKCGGKMCTSNDDLPNIFCVIISEKL